MNRLHALRDDQWEKIKNLLPGRSGHVGVTARDNRLFIDAVLYRYRTSTPWHDLSLEFGDFRVIHTRFTRWCKSGIWSRLFDTLSKDADNEYAMIDSTIVRAHQHSAGAKGGMLTSRLLAVVGGVLSTKIHTIAKRLKNDYILLLLFVCCYIKSQ